MGFVTRQDILKADDIPTETVPVPEWGGDVLVRGLTGAGRDEYFASMTKMRKGQSVPDPVNATAKLVARTIIDPETGGLMFGDEDVSELGRRSAAALHRVEEAAMRLSGLSEEDMSALGEGYVKPEPSTRSGSSTSASPRTSKG